MMIGKFSIFFEKRFKMSNTPHSCFFSKGENEQEQAVMQMSTPQSQVPVNNMELNSLTLWRER